jgi:hypothetical protein
MDDTEIGWKAAAWPPGGGGRVYDRNGEDDMFVRSLKKEEE